MLSRYTSARGSSLGPITARGEGEVKRLSGTDEQVKVVGESFLSGPPAITMFCGVKPTSGDNAQTARSVSMKARTLHKIEHTGIELIVASLFLHQLAVIAPFNDASVLHHHNDVAVNDR